MDELYKTLSDKVQRAISYLPPRLATQLSKLCSETGGADEIALHAGSPITVMKDGEVFAAGAILTDGDMAHFLRSVSGNSLYSHAETIKEGYVVTADGIRVGLCGRAVCDGGRVCAVTGFSSALIRIPSRRSGFADELYGVLSKYDFKRNALVWSPPCGGKTTLLRELVHRMASDERRIKVAVVDTRHEICDGLDGDAVFALSGFPRAKGIEIAVRTLAPDVVVCDEIWSDDDRGAVSFAVGSGASVIASCHASSENDAERRCGVTEVFDVLYGVSKDGRGKIKERAES